jgi:hypothetical protein
MKISKQTHAHLVDPKIAPDPGAAQPAQQGCEGLQLCVADSVTNCDTTKLVVPSTRADDRSPVDRFIHAAELLNVVLVARAQPVSLPTHNSPNQSLAWNPLVHGYTPPQSPTITAWNNAAKAARNKRLRIANLPKETVEAQLNNLGFLGFVSALESYLRSLVTRLVWIDEYVENKVEKLKVSYGAARHHTSKLLAEAFMEDMTFVSRAQIEELLRSVLGVDKHDDKLKAALEEYERICQLRHCIVHRFGKLGSNNAIKLGLQDHCELLEQPILLDAEQLQTIEANLFTLVKAINNAVYDSIMNRQAKRSTKWTWQLKEDEARFTGFYELFATRDDLEPSPSIASAYDAFKKRCEASSATTVQQQKQRQLGHTILKA